MESLLLLLPCFITACSAPSSSDLPDSDSERDVMARKLITLQQAYDRLDENGDGYLSRSEISTGLQSEEFKGVSKDSVALIFEFYDTNKDDLISLDEINAGVQTGPDAALKLKKDHALKKAPQ